MSTIRACLFVLAIAAIAACSLLSLLATEAQADPIQISGVSAGGITTASAIITWSTDEAGNSTVHYGETTDLGSTVSDGAFVTDHAVSLDGLDPGKLFYYQVSSTNGVGETVLSPGIGSYYTFTTDPHSPDISDISAMDISNTSATIRWRTDRLADSTVNYGISTGLGFTASGSTYVLEHSLLLAGLWPDTTYYFEVSSTNQYGNATTDSNNGDYYTFKTQQAPPSISEVIVSDITDTSATVSWTTNQKADSAVYYGNTTSLGYTAADSNFTYEHSVHLTGLNPNTVYYSRVGSTNGDGYTSESPAGSEYYTFRTAVHLLLDGWVWCTNYRNVANATLDAYVALNERENAFQSFSIHAWGNLTLKPASGAAETIELDMYGSRVRSLFYLSEEITGKSLTLTGTWIDTANNQSYVMATGFLGLPNPDGEVFKTARLGMALLRTSDVDVQLRDPVDFVSNVNYVIGWFTKYFDRVLDALVGTGVGQIISDIMAKLMIIIAGIRALGTPYIP
ncbi:MAG: fibronectin type III domain-containing protein [Dehalococcoidia bacterium]|nr:fibronectin type III domain-containing protein [Dehalococcoidia bacterium]